MLKIICFARKHLLSGMTELQGTWNIVIAHIKSSSTYLLCLRHITL
ncbi:MAG: hypothetical protein ACOVSW_21420 [Candidatus Kapaibacteriota bacterium]